MFYWLIELSNTVPGFGIFRGFFNVRQLDELFLAALSDKRQIVGKRITVPQVTLLHK
jgi:hypothetical protein